jgi:hypothetical protein
MADIHPAAQNTQLRVPTDVTKFSGDGTTSADDFISELESWYYILSTPSHVRPRMSSLLLTSAAKEWYNSDFAALPAGEQTWESFQQKLRARFARADESVIARRAQLTFRITRSSPPDFLKSVSEFNAAFTRNQVRIKNQGREDALMAYTECIRLSIPQYPDVSQLQQALDNTLLTLAAEQRTLPKAQEIVATRATNVVDTPAPLSIHAITTQPTYPTYVPRPQGVKRPRAPDGRMSYREARDRKICTYCRDPNADHKQVRAYNNATGKMDGAIICPQLTADIRSGKTVERRPYNAPRAQHLNSSGSRMDVTIPAAK